VTPKQSKKLVLATETLVRLTPDHLAGVVAGFTNVDIKVHSCAWKSCNTSR
jgi:hypothetical protein